MIQQIKKGGGAEITMRLLSGIGFRVMVINYRTPKTGPHLRDTLWIVFQECHQCPSETRHPVSWLS
jgi:hypothetical protein